MSLVPRIYSSTDPGSPVLSGTAGALATMLEAILVSGYGTGADSKPPAGWTTEFSASGKRVFRNNPVSSSGYLLRIDDTGTTGNARHSWVRAYSAMTDVDTGTADPTPTPTQRTNGMMIVKSTLLSATARAWWALATEKWFYLLIDCNGGGIATAVPYFFGDARSNKPGDLHAFLVAGSGLTTYAGATSDNVGALFLCGSLFGNAPTVQFTPNNTACIGYMARNKAGDAGALAVDLMAYTADQAGLIGSNGLWQMTYPDPDDGGFYHYPPTLKETGTRLRGVLPNVVFPMHQQPFADLTPVSGLSSLPGISLIAKSYRANPGDAGALGNGQVLFDLTTEA